MARLGVAGLGAAGLVVAACAPRVDAPGPATQTPMLQADYFRAADGRRLAVRRYPADAPRAIVVAVHGFNDYSNNFGLAGPWFAERGIAVIALDQRGFGETPTRRRWAGTQAMAADVAALVEAVRAENPTIPLYLLGVSMGGAVATVAAASNDLPIEGLILAGPAFWGWSQMNPVYRATLRTAAHVTPWYHLSGEGLSRQPSDNIEMLRALSQDPLIIRKTRIDTIYGLVTLMDEAFIAAADVRVPTLVLFGDKDEIVPIAPVEAVVEQLGTHACFVRYPDGWHMLLRDLQREQVYADIAAWMEGLACPPTLQERVAEEVALTAE